MTDANSPANSSARRYRDLSLLILIGWSLFSGVVDLFLYGNEWALFASFGIAFIIQIGAVLAWCEFDARMRNFVMPGGMRSLIVVLMIVGVAWYFIRTRGIAKAAKVGFGLPLVLISIALYYCAWYGARSILGRIGYFG